MKTPTFKRNKLVKQLTSKKKNQLLTEGHITSVLIKLAAPLIASAFMSTLYTLVDMYWVGKLGAEVIAGVGAAGMFTWLAGGISKLASVGSQVYIGQSLGRKKRKEAGYFAQAGLKLGIFLGILYGLICLTCTVPMIHFFGMTHKTAISTAILYTRIVCGLTVFNYIGLILTAQFTSQGNSQLPMIANFSGLLLNMIVDPLLIFGIGPIHGLGAAGSAIATVFSQFIVAMILISHIKEDNVLREHPTITKIPLSYYKEILKLSWPIALQDTFYCGISMVLSKIVASFGDISMAVMRVGNQIEAVSWNVASGFSTAVNAFIAQNYGAGEKERYRRGYRISTIFVAGEGLLVTFAFILLRVQIASTFFYNEEAISIFCIYLCVIGVSELFMNTEIMTAGALSALGRTSLASTICITLTAMRLPIAFALATWTNLQSTSVWIAISVTSIIKGITMFIAFIKVE